MIRFGLTATALALCLSTFAPLAHANVPSTADTNMDGKAANVFRPSADVAAERRLVYMWILAYRQNVFEMNFLQIHRALHTFPENVCDQYLAMLEQKQIKLRALLENARVIYPGMLPSEPGEFFEEYGVVRH